MSETNEAATDAVSLALAMRERELNIGERDYEIIKEIARHPTHTQGVRSCMELGLLNDQAMVSSHISNLARKGMLELAKDLKQQATQIAVRESSISHAHFLAKLLDEEVVIADQLLTQLKKQGLVLQQSCAGSHVYSRALRNMQATLDMLGGLTGVTQMREYEALKQKLELQVQMAANKEIAMKEAKDADDPANQSALTNKPTLDDYDLIA